MFKVYDRFSLLLPRRLYSLKVEGEGSREAVVDDDFEAWGARDEDREVEDLNLNNDQYANN